MGTVSQLLCVTLLVSTISLGQSQEAEFANVLKNLLQGQDQLQMIQNIFSALPIELRDKLTKDLFANAGNIGPEMLTNLMPYLQQFLMANMQKPKQALPTDNQNGVENMNLDYKDEAGKKKRQDPSAGGFDFGAIGSILGNLVSSNPQMLMDVMSSFLQGGNGQGLSFDSIASMLTNQLDVDTIMNLAQSFGLVGGADNNDRRRGEGDAPKKGGIADMLKINELLKSWNEFASSPFGKKVNRVLPRLLKSETLPDALRILEKETSFRFDLILRQLQDPHIRSMLVAQTVKPIGQFFESITIPDDFKEVMSKADDLLNKKLGLGVKVKEYIEPIFTYIRDTFHITRESLLDFKAKDIEKIATDVLNNEILQPLSLVWDAHEKARKNSGCASFVYCQLNHNFYNENFIRRNVIKTSSIISAFQASAAMKRDAFSQLYEGAYKGAEGYDCTHGVNTRCLDLMDTAPHNEL